MSHIRVLRIIITLLLGLLAVQALSRDQAFGSGRGARISVLVADAQTEDPLIGAAVVISSGSEVLQGTTSKQSDYFGLQARYDCDRIFRDSVTLQVSFVGYKPYSKRFAASEFSRYIRVQMQIDEQSIAQVVVVGQRIAMVYRGDTTIYNAAAFKTLEDDRLSEILRQLPGVEIKEDKIYADGEEVKRVYVDGRNLFGQQTSASLTDLKANDVAKVRVYEQQSAEAKHMGDNTARKEKVMDIETKSKRGALLGGKISAMGGMSMERDYSGRREVRHAEELQLYRHTTNGSTNINFSNTKDDGQREGASMGSKVTPSKSIEAAISHELRRGDTTTLWTYASFNQARQSSLKTTQTDYFATDEYTLRSENSRSESLSKGLSTAIGSMARILRGKSAFGANVNFRYGQDASTTAMQTHQIVDADQTSTRLNTQGDGRDVNLDIALNYKYNITKRSSIAVVVGGDYSTKKGGDWRLDTLASTPGLRTQLRSNTNGDSYSYNALVNYRYKTGEKSALSAGYNFRRMYSKSKQLSIDYLDDPRGVLDSINSYDYTIDYYTNSLTLSWDYRSDIFSLYTNLIASRYDLVRDERFPEMEHAPRHFFNLAPSVLMVFGKSRRKLDFNIGASPAAPSAEALRRRLDATNPLQLRAGNPDLKLPMNLSGNLRFYINDAKAARSFSVGVSANYSFNNIASQRTLFLQDTYLPLWDYTAQKGSQLTSSVNVGGNYNLGSSLSYSQQLASLRSTIRTNLNYGFQQTPYFLGELLYKSGSHSLSMHVGFDTGFSTKVKLSINSTTSLSSYTTQSDTRHDLRERVNARVDLRFGRYFGFLGTLYEFYCNSSSKALTSHNVILNAAAGRKFGKDNRFSVSIGAMDMLSGPNFASTRFNTDYILTSVTSYLSRYAYLELSYTF